MDPKNRLTSATQASVGIAAFDQYEHPASLDILIKAHKELAATLGGNYFITPDFVIGRGPLTDYEIDLNKRLLGQDQVATLTS